MKLPGRGCQLACWGPLAQALFTVLVLLPLISLLHGTLAEAAGIAPRHSSIATEAASSHSWHCPPARGHDWKSCVVMPCCGVTHDGCCPLPVVGTDLHGALFATPGAIAGPAFASLRGPPPLPPPIISSDR